MLERTMLVAYSFAGLVQFQCRSGCGRFLLTCLTSSFLYLSFRDVIRGLFFHFRYVGVEVPKLPS